MDAKRRTLHHKLASDPDDFELRCQILVEDVRSGGFDGELIVLWLEIEEGRAHWRLRAVPSAGPPSDSFLLADVPAGRVSGHARIAVDPRGGLVAAWTDPTENRVLTARIVRAE